MKNYLIITGASRGIGYATVAKFIQQQWRVINLSRSACDIDGVINIKVDLMDPNWHSRINDELIGHINHPEKICLVHNSASCQSDTIKQLSASELRQVLELNVVAPTLLNQIALPLMKPGSSIIYIGSTLSEKAVPNNASYVTSKHAVAGLMKATCQDLDNTGIHTCCICPGLTDTQMLRERVNHDESLLDMFRNMSSAKRLIEPAEIADFIWFCSTNPVINGAVLHANLGQIER